MVAVSSFELFEKILFSCSRISRRSRESNEFNRGKLADVVFVGLLSSKLVELSTTSYPVSSLVVGDTGWFGIL